MEDTKLDANLEQISEEIATMKHEMFYRINKTKSNKALLNGKEEKIEAEMKNMKDITAEEYVSKFNEIDSIFKKDKSELYASHERYIYSCKRNFDNMLMEEIDDGYEYKKDN